MPKIKKDSQLKKTIHDVHATGEAFSSQTRKSGTSKLEISSLF
jgi:hypothetical protein